MYPVPEVTRTEGVYMKTMNNAAIAEILNHDNFIGSVLDCAEDMKAIESATIKNVQNRVLGGIETKHDYRMAKSAERDDEYWQHVSEMYGLGNLSFTPQDTVHEGDERPKAKVKASIKRNIKKLHKSYVSAPKSLKMNDEESKRSFKAYCKSVERMAEKDPLYDDFTPKDNVMTVKFTGFEFRKPYMILQAIKADDVRERLTHSRTRDDESPIYFVLEWKLTNEGKENEDITRLRRFLKGKIQITPNMTFKDALDQLVGMTTTISLINEFPRFNKDGSRATWTKKFFDKKSKKWKEREVPAFTTNPEFLAFPTYDYSDKIDDGFDRKSRDYIGAYYNIHISHRMIAEENGDISFRKTPTSVDVYSGDKFLRSYPIHS
jgi:hypothetical protein